MKHFTFLLFLLGAVSCRPVNIHDLEKNSEFRAAVDWLSEVDAPEVGIRVPSGDFYFVKQAGLSCKGFEVTDNEIIIDTNAAYGTKWVEGGAIIDRLFVSAGEYKLIVSENLEGDIQSNFISEISIKISDVRESEGAEVFPAACTMDGEG